MSGAAGFLQFRQYLVEGKAARLLPRRELHVRLQMTGHKRLCRDKHESVLYAPPVVVAGHVLGDLERIGAQVDQLRETKRDQRILPHGETLGPLLHEQELPAVIAKSREVPVISPI